MVIATGGGFQFFNIMYGNGGMVQPWAIPIWENTAAFCREREFCHKAVPVHQIGIVYPMERINHKEKLYTRHIDSFRALCAWNNALLESGFSTEVIYQTEPEALPDFPVVILPTAPNLDADVPKFRTYVENGGHLIVDLGSVHYFEAFAGISATSCNEQLFFLAGRDAVASAEGKVIRFNGDFTVTGKAYPDNYFSDSPIPLAVNKRIGKGSITLMATDFAKVYENNVTTAIRHFITDVVYATGFRPLVEISGSSYGDLVVTEKEGKLLVNIVNTAGPGGLSKVRSYNEIPKIGPITVKVNRTGIRRITRMPEGTPLDFAYTDGCAQFTLDTVHIHTAAVIEFA